MVGSNDNRKYGLFKKLLKKPLNDDCVHVLLQLYVSDTVYRMRCVLVVKYESYDKKFMSALNFKIEQNTMQKWETKNKQMLRNRSIPNFSFRMF